MAKPDYSMRPLTAWRALKLLIADPERTEQVFVIVRALSGRSLPRAYARFRKTDTGQRILNEKRSLLDTLSDREALRELPAGSLGRAYLKFVETESITADGLVEASEYDAEWGEEGGLRLYAERSRDMHDLWHVTTGYGRDVLGEACLLAFTVAQVKNPGLALITVAGALKIARERGSAVYRAVWSGFRAGRRAEWLPAQDWEALLAQPLEDVRKQLGVSAPEVYPEILAEAATA